MPPAEAAECVKGIAPKVVYLVHYDNAASSRVDNPKAANSSESVAISAANRAGIEAFKKALAGTSIEVRSDGFYPPW
jgi:L-ascorbate metabolism protein UlaG (beta-lactamase superfamily)